MMDSNWMPMATAPRDGREVMALWGRGGATLKVSWDGRRWVSDFPAGPLQLLGWMPLRAAAVAAA